MKNWMPVKGNFIKDGECIIFKGMSQQAPDNSTSPFFSSQPAPDGIVLFEDMISTGTIETSVKFDNYDKR